MIATALILGMGVVSAETSGLKTTSNSSITNTSEVSTFTKEILLDRIAKGEVMNVAIKEHEIEVTFSCGQVEMIPISSDEDLGEWLEVILLLDKIICRG